MDHMPAKHKKHTHTHKLIDTYQGEQTYKLGLSFSIFLHIKCRRTHESMNLFENDDKMLSIQSNIQRAH